MTTSRYRAAGSRVAVEHVPGLATPSAAAGSSCSPGQPGTTPSEPRKAKSYSEVSETMTSSAPRTHRIGGFGSRSARLVDPEVIGRQGVQHPPGAGRHPGQAGARWRITRVVILAEPGGQHRFDEDVQVLRDERRLDVVRQQHLPRRQRRVAAAVAGGQLGDEPGIGAAAAGADAGRLGQPPSTPRVPPKPKGDTGLTSVTDARSPGASSRYCSTTPPPMLQPTSAPGPTRVPGRRRPRHRSSPARRGWHPPAAGSVSPNPRRSIAIGRYRSGSASISGCQNRLDETLPCTSSTGMPVPAVDLENVDGQAVGVDAPGGDPGQQCVHRVIIGAAAIGRDRGTPVRASRCTPLPAAGPSRSTAGSAVVPPASAPSRPVTGPDVRRPC